ncbi:MAG: hypothetical protein AAB306_01465 [Pseudomonadota bacterium]
MDRRLHEIIASFQRKKIPWILSVISIDLIKSVLSCYDIVGVASGIRGGHRRNHIDTPALLWQDTRLNLRYVQQSQSTS